MAEDAAVVMQVLLERRAHPAEPVCQTRIIDPRVDLDLFGIEGLLDIRSRAALVIRNGNFSPDSRKSEKRIPRELPGLRSSARLPTSRVEMRSIDKVYERTSPFCLQFQPVDGCRPVFLSLPFDLLPLAL